MLGFGGLKIFDKQLHIFIITAGFSIIDIMEIADIQHSGLFGGIKQDIKVIIGAFFPDIADRYRFFSQGVIKANIGFKLVEV